MRVVRVCLLMAGSFGLSGFTGNVEAGEPSPEIKPTKKWESVATVGVTLTRGNSENFMASGSAATKRSWMSDELLFGASAGYGETETDGDDRTTDSYVKGYGQWNHLFSRRFYAGLRVTGEHDDVADLAYRATVSPLVGYYFIRETNAFFCGEIGPSYVREKFFHEDTDDYIGLRIGERAEKKFASGAKIWESAEYIPKIEDFQNYLINAEIGVSAPISKALSLSLVLTDTYKSVPAAGKKQNDLKLIAGISYNF